MFGKIRPNLHVSPAYNLEDCVSATAYQFEAQVRSIARLRATYSTSPCSSEMFPSSISRDVSVLEVDILPLLRLLFGNESQVDDSAIPAR